MKQIRKYTDHLSVSIIALLLWSAGLGIVSLFFARGRYLRTVFFSYFDSPALLLLNVLPVVLLTALLFVVFNRVWAAALGSGAVVLTASFINHIKLTLRNDPLLATDVRYISEAADIGGSYNMALNRHMMLCIALVAVGTVLFVLFFPGRMKKGAARRIICIAAVIILSAAAFCTLYRSEKLYNATENLSDGMSKWSASDQYVCRGFFYPFLYSFRDFSDGKPAGYSRAESAGYAASLGSSDIPEGKKISVIAVMLEAYNDFSKFGTLQFTDDPYADLHALEAESAYGELVTNIFSGGTIDTERCFVTGATSLVNYRAPADSLARYLSAQGYATSFCHTGYEWFYNRQNVADHLGFDVHYFYENRYFGHNDYGAMNDAHFLPDLVTQWEDSLDAGKPFFNFSVTYQNHGPYSDSELMYEKTYVAQDGLSEQAWYILNNYLAGVAETGAALRELSESLRASDEPAALVFFGDHNPWMGDRSWVFPEIGVSFEGDAGFYNYYSTPWVIWLNDSAREIVGDSYTPGDKGSFSPCFLQMELFDLLGWDGSVTVKALRALHESTDVIHVTGAVRLPDGTLTREPDEATKEAVMTYKKLEYYLRKDFQK